MHKPNSDSVSTFKSRVIEIVQNIPYGSVMSYGQVALYIGVPRAARQVGWVLNKTEGKIGLPWWRVVNNKGYLSIRGTMYNDKSLQRRLLLSEGVQVSEEFVIDMKKYRYIADKNFLKKMRLKKEYLNMISVRIF